MSRLRLLLSTIQRLGLGATATVAAYRLACQSGLYRRLLPCRVAANDSLIFSGKRVSPQISDESKKRLLDHAEEMLKGEFAYFHACRAKIGSPPDWFLDPFRNRRIGHAGHWSAFNEFADGDIKVIWEPSRFEWMPLLAQAWLVSGDDRFLAHLNTWLQDWVQQNPPNTGPNWKCGQEASIRLLNLLLAARLLGIHREPFVGLENLVVLHCERIQPTIRYAIAQNNNHGTSEAAALFVGGAWLASRTGLKRARAWRDAGRSWLEDRLNKLVDEDGCFSQYSINYHRVLIDTLNQVELWRRELNEPRFSSLFNARCRAAVDFLITMTDRHRGDAPNIGANDGARLYNVSSTPYRDFRPSVQLSSVLFKDTSTFESGDCDEPLKWFGLTVPPLVPAAEKSRILPTGGFVIIRKGESQGVLRAPNFRFRPSHADALHLDFWHRGENLLRDGGSYSYNSEPRWHHYFTGSESHNTVQFDGHDQMPRLGRFLFGAWLKMDESSNLSEDDNKMSWSGAYTDYAGCHHRRTVEAKKGFWRIIDDVRGYKQKAILRWRLMPETWDISGLMCHGRQAKLEVTTEGSLHRLELVTGWESRHYFEKTKLPVLEVEAGPPEARFITTVELKG